MVLVLDDFQVITDGALLRSIERLLDHQPPQLHIVLTTRADPPLRLQRRRVAGELADIRAGDLAFTAAEAGKLLAGCGIHLTDRQLVALLNRTQGWAAGLRLAVLSLDAGDVDGAIDRFTGNDGLVAEYLIEEVLDRMPSRDRQFLLETSVAGKISPELANSLTGRADGQQVLERLSRKMRLVIELAGNSDWFGFHPCCGNCCCDGWSWNGQGLPRTCTGAPPDGSRAQGDPVSAIRHSCQAQDWELVGHLVATIAWPLALTSSGPALAPRYSRRSPRPCTVRPPTPCWPLPSATTGVTNSSRCCGNARVWRT